MKVGLVLPLVEGWPPRRTSPYEEIRDLALEAERSGLDSLWLSDHLLFARPGHPVTGVWEAWTILSAVAEATSRIDLGTLVVSAGFRNPGLLAKMAVTLDEVSGGRLILGLGAGSQPSDYRPFGLTFDHRFDRFEEFLPLLLGLLREGRVRHYGRWFQIDAEVRPRGPRNGAIPVLIAASGPRMMELTARYADGWSPAGWAGPSEQFAERLAVLRGWCAEVGRDPCELTITATLVADARVDSDDAGGATDQPGVEPYVALRGDARGIAGQLAAWEGAGVDHAIVDVRPATTPGFRVIAEAVALLRGGGLRSSFG